MKHIITRSIAYTLIISFFIFGTYNLFKTKSVSVASVEKVEVAKKVNVSLSKIGRARRYIVSLTEEINQKVNILQGTKDIKKREELKIEVLRLEDERKSSIAYLDRLIKQDTKIKKLKKMMDNKMMNPDSNSKNKVETTKTEKVKEKAKEVVKKTSYFVYILIGIIVILIVSILVMIKYKKKPTYEVTDKSGSLTDRIKVVTNNTTDKMIVVLKEPKIKPFEKVLGILVLILTFLNTLKEFLFG